MGDDVVLPQDTDAVGAAGRNWKKETVDFSLTDHLPRS